MSIFARSSELTERKPKAADRPWGFAEDLGRYWLPDPEDSLSWEPGSFGAKHFPRGYMRMTNLTGALSETRALNIWEQKKMLRGMRERHDIFAQLLTADLDDEGDIIGHQKIVDLALRQAKADEASVIGTAYHKVLEHHLRTGQWIGTPLMISETQKLLRMLSDHLLVPVREYAERIVVNTTLKTAGRFDVPVHSMLTGRLLMADLKTKRKKFWTVMEQRAQLAGYAYADAMWDEQLQCYVKPPGFDKTEGIIFHVPQSRTDESPPISLLRMDLEKGWRTAQLAREIVDMRAEAKSAPMLREIEMEPPAYASAEHWEARLRLVTSLAEGSVILANAKEAFPDAAPMFDRVAAEVAKDLVGAS